MPLLLLRFFSIRIVRTALCSLLITLVIGSAFGGIMAYAETAKPAPALIKETVQYSFLVRNTASEKLPRVVLNLFVPLPQTATQKRLMLEVSEPYSLIKDGYGNEWAKVILLDVAPYERKVIRLRAEIAFGAESDDRAPKAAAFELLNSEIFVNTQHPAIENAARPLKGLDVTQTARNIFKWITDSIEIEPYTAKPQGAVYALRTRKGDCTEQMYLFLALARTNGLPSRGVAGYLLSGQGGLSKASYHNWAEVLIDDKWTLVDPHQKQFGSSQKRYMATNFVAPQSASYISLGRFASSHDKVELSLQLHG